MFAASIFLCRLRSIAAHRDHFFILCQLHCTANKVNFNSFLKVHIFQYPRFYVGGSKSSETNPIPENGLILSD